MVQSPEGFSPQSFQEPKPTEFYRPEYQDILITLEQASGAEKDAYVIKIISDNKSVFETIRLDGEKINQIIHELRKPFEQTRPARPLAVATDLNENPPPLAPILKQGGLCMFEWLFVGKVREAFMKLLEDGKSYRFIWDLENAPPVLPVEILYVPAPVRRHLALTWRYSIVRRVSNVLSPPLVQLVQPLRILAVFANPKDTAPLSVEEEEQVLRRSLGDALQNRQVQLKVLGSSADGPERIASLENLQRQLQVFQPHIFHFVGHGAYDGAHDDAQGNLIFEDENKYGRLVSAEQIATILADSQIKLAVLNGCDTGVASQNNAITGVAGALINAGIPAVIATMRFVLDKAAILFTRKFYNVFASGYDLESAIVEARKALSVEDLDWSTYALFKGNSDLNDLVVLNR